MLGFQALSSTPLSDLREAQSFVQTFWPTWYPEELLTAWLAQRSDTTWVPDYAETEFRVPNMSTIWLGLPGVNDAFRP